MYNNSKVVLCSFADTALIDSILRFGNQAKALKFSHNKNIKFPEQNSEIIMGGVNILTILSYTPRIVYR